MPITEESTEKRNITKYTEKFLCHVNRWCVRHKQCDNSEEVLHNSEEVLHNTLESKFQVKTTKRKASACDMVCQYLHSLPARGGVLRDGQAVRSSYTGGTGRASVHCNHIQT